MEKEVLNNLLKWVTKLSCDIRQLCLKTTEDGTGIVHIAPTFVLMTRKKVCQNSSLYLINKKELKTRLW